MCWYSANKSLISPSSFLSTSASRSLTHTGAFGPFGSFDSGCAALAGSTGRISTPETARTGIRTMSKASRRGSIFRPFTRVGEANRGIGKNGRILESGATWAGIHWNSPLEIALPPEFGDITHAFQVIDG